MRDKNQVEQRIQEGLMSGAILPPDTPLIYENYKEPLRKVKNGFGYMGTLATNEEKTHVQCHYCGLLFKSLSPHLRSKHNTTGKSYREEFGLMVTTVLIGEGNREQRIKNGEFKPSGRKDLPPWLAQYNHDVQVGIIKHKPGKKRMTLEERNKLGVCPDQLLEKITVLAKKLGRTPSHDEFRAEYHHRYIFALKGAFGSWNKAVRAAGMVSVGEQHKEDHSPERLIQYLKDFKKLHGRIPMTSDFRRGLLPPRYHYHKVFGTLNDARVAAGMNAIVALPRHQWMEVPAEEWEEYRTRLLATSSMQRKVEANKRWYQRKQEAKQ